MPDPIILPNCLLNTYKLMFPTLDFSRVHFYDGIIFPFSLGSEAAITLNSFPNNIDIYLKKGMYDPCSLYTFQKLGHELVHALQAEQGFGSAWFGSWDFNYLNALGGTFSTESPANPYEKEAYDFEDKIASCRFVPCQCNNKIPWITSTPDPKSHLEACGLVKTDAAAGWAETFKSTISAVEKAFGSGAWFFVGAFAALIWFVIVFVLALVAMIIVEIIDAIIAAVKSIINSFIDLFSHDTDGSLNVMFSLDDGSTFDNKITFGRSSEAPALAFDASHLYVGWTDTDNKVTVLVAPTPSTTTFEKANDDGPALAFGNGQLFVAWQGTDNHLNIMSSADGKNFGNKITLLETSKDNATPGLAYGDGRLYLSWIGTDNRINIISSPDGLSWGGKITLDDTSGDDATPALALGNGVLYLAWAGTDDNHPLNVMTLSHDMNGVLTQSARVTLQESSTRKAGPGLAFGDEWVFLAWTGTDDQLNVLSSADGQNFGNKQTFEKSSNDAGPALAFGQGILCISWIGQA